MKLEVQMSFQGFHSSYRNILFVRIMTYLPRDNFDFSVEPAIKDFSEEPAINCRAGSAEKSKLSRGKLFSMCFLVYSRICSEFIVLTALL